MVHISVKGDFVWAGIALFADGLEDKSWEAGQRENGSVADSSRPVGFHDVYRDYAGSLLYCWAVLYTCYPNSLHLGGPTF